MLLLLFLKNVHLNMGQKFYSIKVSKPKLMLQLIRGVGKILIVDSKYKHNSIFDFLIETTWNSS